MSRKASEWLALAMLLATSGYLLFRLTQSAGDPLPAYDVYGLSYPLAVHGADAIRHGGRGLFWNALQNCGQPFMGAGVPGVLYPPFLFFLFLDGLHALYAHFLFDVAVGAIGAYLLCRELGTGTVAALSGALAFAFGNAAVEVLTSTPLVSGPYAWLPAAILLCERILREPTARRGTALGVVLTLALLPGHPQPLLYIYQLIGARVAYETATRPSWLGRRSVGALLLGLALPLGLGAVHLLPALEVMRESVRNAKLLPSELQITPFLSWKSIGDNLAIRRELFNPFVLAPVMLAGAAAGTPRLRRQGIFYLLAALLSFDLSLGPNGHLFPILQMMPFAMIFRAPERYLWITEFAIAVLVAIGVDALLRPAAERTWRASRVAVLILPVAALLALHAWQPSIGTVRGERFVIVLVLAGCASAVSSRRHAAGVLLVAALILDLVTFRMPPVRHLVRSDELYARAEIFRFLKDRMTSQDRVYVVGRDADSSLQQNTSELFGLRALYNYYPLQTRRFAEYFEMLRATRRLQSLNEVLYPISLLTEGTSRPLLARAAVRYLVVGEPQSAAILPPPPLVLLLERDGVRVYENTTALPRARWVPRVEVTLRERLIRRLANADVDPTRVALVDAPPPSGFVGAAADGATAAVDFLRDDPERVVLQVDAPARGFVLLADQWFPGWRATVDGAPAPIFQADWTFRAVEVPAGRSTVEFAYVPRALYLGASISVATVAALALAWRLSRGTRRPSKTELARPAAA